jgi:putative hemolysin
MSASLEISAKTNPFIFNNVYGISNNTLPGRITLKACHKALGLDYLAYEYSKLPAGYSPGEFVKQSFKTLGLNYKVLSGSLQNIPETGATMVIANHPFGGIEGMLMVELLLQRRKDIRIITNKFLKMIPELSELFIGVNPYGGKDAVSENTSAMREGIRWLQQGGILVMFPAGDVSSIYFKDMAINDGAWGDSVARIATKTKACIIPLHFEGYNSMAFYLASMVHPVLKTALLARQLINKRGKTINLHIGKTVSHSRLMKLNTNAERVAYLRLRSYFLAYKQKKTNVNNPQNAPVFFNLPEPIIKPVSKHKLQSDIEQLPVNQLLIESATFQVFHATSNQIPHVLKEIGRLREISFREAGEGTGKKIDIDVYDSFYHHLFLWNSEKHEIIGSYRLGLTDEILYKYGRKGLYSYSLFKFKTRFLQSIYPAIELGRSFIRPEYQRNFAPLMLLWKGIGAYIVKHPQYSILFGPVSISNDYSAMSQKIIIDYMQNNASEKQLIKLVRPRNPCFKKTDLPDYIKMNRSQTIDKVSDIIADIESDSKGIPILIRQYLKLGAKMLGFNRDKAFNNTIDGLIRVDLRETDPRILSKYMGFKEAEYFLEWHHANHQHAG